MALHRDVDEVSALACDERLRVVVTLTADRTESLFNSLVSLEALKVIQTVAVVDMTAAQDALVSKLQAFKANRTWLIDLTAYKEFLLYVMPLVLTKWLGWLLNQPESLSQTQVVNILHPFLLDVIKGTLLSHLSSK